MTYLDQIADLVREAVPSDVGIPEDADRLFLLYALLVRVRGEATTLRDVHDAWSAWMEEIDPNHKSLVPFEELPADVQDEDAPFVAAIRSVASKLA